MRRAGEQVVAGPRVGEEALRVEGTASAKAERWDIQLILARSLCRETRALGHVGMLARLAGRLMRGRPCVPGQGLSLPPENDGR